MLADKPKIRRIQSRYFLCFNQDISCVSIKTFLCFNQHISCVSIKTFLCFNQDMSCVSIKTFLVFQWRHSCVSIKKFRVLQSRYFSCSNQYNVCVPIKMIRMFQSRHFVISKKDDSSSFHIIISSNHIYNESPFCPKITKKNFDTTFTPPPKVAQTRKWFHRGSFFETELPVVLKPA